MIFSKRTAREVQDAYARGVEDGRKLAAEKFGWSIYDIPNEAIAAKELQDFAYGDLSRLLRDVQDVLARAKARASALEQKSSTVGSRK